MYQRFPGSCDQFHLELPHNTTSLRVAVEITEPGVGDIGAKVYEYEDINEGHTSEVKADGTIVVDVEEPARPGWGIMIYSHGVVVEKKFLVRAETVALSAEPLTIEPAC